MYWLVVSGSVAPEQLIYQTDYIAGGGGLIDNVDHGRDLSIGSGLDSLGGKEACGDRPLVHR